jgi:Predicted esterase
MVMVHGRGASAESIMTLIPAIDVGDFAYFAPNASGGTWYPNSFLAPIHTNQPGMASGLDAIDSVIESIVSGGIPVDRIVLLGFSQGACLSLEYSARNARRYGGITCLSGGLIGPDGTPRNYPGSYGGTPVFMGCSDIDPHIPASRVRESAEVLQRMGAHVTMKLYPGMGHLVSQDEIDNVRALMEEVKGAGN